MRHHDLRRRLRRLEARQLPDGWVAGIRALAARREAEEVGPPPRGDEPVRPGSPEIIALLRTAGVPEPRDSEW